MYFTGRKDAIMRIGVILMLPFALSLAGCGLFLPPGDPPESITGKKPDTVNRNITMAQAESSMCVALTQFVVRKQLAPVRLTMLSSEGINTRFLNSLDPNLFRLTTGRDYEYLLISALRGSVWTLSLKKKDAREILWTKTIERIQK